jgi:peptidoglycan/LPS O-acetylase OafA/YrhL
MEGAAAKHGPAMSNRVVDVFLPGVFSLTSRYYRPELDLLRFFAFVLVYLSHVVPGDVAFFTGIHVPWLFARGFIALSAGGAWGVDLFFALSSYLITTILLREQQQFGRIAVGSFYARRALRIWPLYFVFLLIIVPLVRGFFPAGDMSSRYLVTFALFVGNWACVFWGYPHPVMGPLWSVSIEEQFYLTWPLILRRWLEHVVIIACVLLVISFATRVWLVFHGAVHPQIWCNTLARLDPIACGALLAVYTQRRQLTLSDRARAALLTGGLLVLAVIGRFGDFTGARALVTFPLGTLASMLLLAGVLGISVPVKSAFCRLGIFLGRISYGLYVFHFLFIEAFAVPETHDPVARFVRIAAAFAATTVVAACSYRFLEQPFLRLKDRFSQIGTAAGYST